MIKINLLSSDDKISIKWEKINCFVKANLFLIAFIQILIIASFVGTVFYVEMENKSVARELEDMRLRPEIRELELIKNDIRRHNRQSNAYLKIQEGQIYWTKIFDHLSQITTAEVRINSISIEPKVIIDKVGASRNKKAKTDPNAFDVEIRGSFTDGDSFRKVFEYNLNNSDIFMGFMSDPGNYDTNKVFKHNLFVERKSLSEY